MEFFAMGFALYGLGAFVFLAMLIVEDIWGTSTRRKNFYAIMTGFMMVCSVVSMVYIAFN